MANQRKVPADARREWIVKTLRHSDFIRISDICDEFGVTAMTARNDLQQLEQSNSLKRVRGGAIPPVGELIPSFSEQLARHSDAKQAIGRMAADTVYDGDSILLGGGSTMFEFFRALQGKRQLTVITDSLQILDYGAEHYPTFDLICTGGVLQRRHRQVLGQFLRSSLTDVLVDKCFIGADALETSFGFLTPSAGNAEAKVKFMECSRKKYILMDSTKVNGEARPFIRFAKLEDIDGLFMDADVDGIVARAASALENPPKLYFADSYAGLAGR
ncbi:MAG: DeoR/GlpR family DNA-binding transcription regulator [Atopobiaceae bacterium]|jgi:DeoR/GlpR family transcriptional regulator of sugar metabolism|nr:DeoR/GlpR family DNA-binding transcription regulator [Atopobiaceae bacterium]MCH4120337.1 DeoR/GlpR family DNA-binding transcription regulator [Atopobiaceae bacterium]MCI1389454.1 DeoR/GlpR family DNA-binding transcription regulator [Atopobiaceae bacterium]MCI1432265.1 DeoR/GlpR family DNA-binding transcription regulator [Atopobiaceae bacterium]MCI1470723.1 DeoR/GlpR family DNA-binding transcription regulator [Atopobiaceae bacterium]